MSSKAVGIVIVHFSQYIFFIVNSINKWNCNSLAVSTFSFPNSHVHILYLKKQQLIPKWIFPRSYLHAYEWLYRWRRLHRRDSPIGTISKLIYPSPKILHGQLQIPYCKELPEKQRLATVKKCFDINFYLSINLENIEFSSRNSLRVRDVLWVEFDQKVLEVFNSWCVIYYNSRSVNFSTITLVYTFLGT